jgi:hypothetical protein
MDAVSMDTQMDALASQLAEREAIRQRAEEILERTARTLAEPRDPEVVRRAAEAVREHQTRKAEERAAEASRAAREHVPLRVQKAAPAPAPAPVAYITKEWMDGFIVRERERRNKAIDATAKAIVDKVAETFASARTKTNWRQQEAERRIADLEARLAKLEGRADG